MIDIANTTVCFRLSIKSEDFTSGAPIIQGACDLFNLVSLYYNGTQLNQL